MDTTPTRLAPDAIFAIPPPLLSLDFSIRHQVTIHWGPNPCNERNNARPAGTFGCEIQFARGRVPAEEALWTQLGIGTESPLIHNVHDSEPVTYAYRARYLSRNAKYGPFGAPATCTVSV